MRGRLWSLVVAAVFAGITVRALNVGYDPSTANGAASDAAGVLDVLSPIAGHLVLLVGIGAFISYTWGRSF